MVAVTITLPFKIFVLKILISLANWSIHCSVKLIIKSKIVMTMLRVL